MKMLKIFNGIGATANNDYDFTANGVSPFNVGNDVVMMVCGTEDMDFTTTFLTDSAVSGTFAELIAAFDNETALTKLFNITIPDTLRATIASRSAGTVDVYLISN